MNFARISQALALPSPVGLAATLYKHGDHIADHICPRGQKQQPCECEVCAYWRNKYPSEG